MEFERQFLHLFFFFFFFFSSSFREILMGEEA